MDSEKSIAELSTLRTILQNEITKKNEQIGYLDTAIKLLTEGYQEDTKRIQDAIQVKDAEVAEIIAVKDSVIEAKEAEIISLKDAKIEVVSELEKPLEEIKK